MMKTTLALFASALLAISSALAGDMACCASKTGKMECSQIYAKLDLTPEQKTKLDAFQARCEKDGCSDASMNKFFEEAKGVLSTKQYARLKAECSKMEQKRAPAGS